MPSLTAVMPWALITAGMPSSRATMAAWLSTAPLSHTTATAPRKSGVHDGSVIDLLSQTAAGHWPGGKPQESQPEGGRRFTYQPGQ